MVTNICLFIIIRKFISYYDFSSLSVLESWLDYTGELEPPEPLARLPQLKHRMKQLLSELGKVQQIALYSSTWGCQRERFWPQVTEATREEAAREDTWWPQGGVMSRCWKSKRILFQIAQGFFLHMKSAAVVHLFWKVVCAGIQCNGQWCNNTWTCMESKHRVSGFNTQK